MRPKREATIDDLYRVPENGKAELVNGELMGELTMDFVRGAPVFAVEVRSKGEYGPRAERDMAAKRADYFGAGTLVVWDVDLRGADVVRAYRADDPERPTVFRRGESASAEPAVPDWSMPVDDLFPA